MMNTAEEKSLSVLFARLDDLCRTARQGSLGVSCFLSPRELHFAKKHLASEGALFFEWGGYDDAERKKIYATNGNDGQPFCLSPIHCPHQVKMAAADHSAAAIL